MIALILQPLPSHAVSGFGGGRHTDTHSTRNFGDIFISLIGATKLPNLFFGEICFSMFFTAICCAVLYAIHAIVRAGSPSQMLWIYTFAVAAVMCGIAQIRRTGTTRDVADQPVNTVFPSVNSNSGVTARVDSKRPFDTIFGFVPQRSYGKSNGFRALHLSGLTKFWALVNGRFTCHF